MVVRPAQVGLYLMCGFPIPQAVVDQQIETRPFEHHWPGIGIELELTLAGIAHH